MKADTLDLMAIFLKPVQYVVPMFQRPYVWNEQDNWVPLWTEIRIVADRLLLAAAEAPPDELSQEEAMSKTPPHFLGAVVFDQKLSGTGSVERRQVIDGQQRLTTLQVFLTAARDVMAARGMEGPAALLTDLVQNTKHLCKGPDDGFKVMPTATDRDSFRATISSGGKIPKEAGKFVPARIPWTVEQG